jgi:hypothetical protein
MLILQGTPSALVSSNLSASPSCWSAVEAIPRASVELDVAGLADLCRKNVARAWTMETAVMCGRELSENLPYNQ